MTTQETHKFNKSDFIRSRPNLKVQEIIDEAKKVGQTISPGAIWTLRSADKRKIESKKAAKNSCVALATNGKKVEKFNKSDFIRKHPKLSALDIIAKAKELGQNITAGMVYTIRSTSRNKEEHTTKAPKTAKSPKKAPTRPLKAPKAKAPTIHHSISFDPSDPIACKFIAAGLAAIGQPEHEEI